MDRDLPFSKPKTASNTFVGVKTEVLHTLEALTIYVLLDDAYLEIFGDH